MSGFDSKLSFDWSEAWRDLRLPIPAPDVLATLLAHWSEPHRKYHTPQHLRGFLARPALFSTPACADRLAAPARANLARAIAELA